MFKRIRQALGLSKKDKKDKNGPKGEISQSLRDFKNRPIYTVLTAEIMDNTPDNKLLQVVYDNVLKKLPKDYSKEYETVMKWNKSRQAIFWIWMLEVEVCNGGFNQFYFNSIGKYAEFIPDALRLVGAPSHAELVQQANDTFRQDHSKITEEQDDTLEGFSKSYEDNPLNVYNKLFYEVEERESVRQKMTTYIRNHPSEFIDK